MSLNCSVLLTSANMLIDTVIEISRLTGQIIGFLINKELGTWERIVGTDLDIAIANESEKIIRKCNFFPFTKMNFDRDYELFGEIKKLDIMRCDFVVMWYTDTGIEEINNNAYGESLDYVKAGEFSKIREREKLSKWNRAILQFLDNIDANEIVVLHWC